MMKLIELEINLFWKAKKKKKQKHLNQHLKAFHEK